MWIFLNDAFFSIVADNVDPEFVVVRARVRDDLEKTFGHDIEVIEMDDSDYRFRTWLEKIYVAEVIGERILDIDYTNFKSSISKEDKDRSNYYLRVWAIMNDWQVKVFGENWKNWYLNYRR
jgi:hypothetical protein